MIPPSQQRRKGIRKGEGCWRVGPPVVECGSNANMQVAAVQSGLAATCWGKLSVIWLCLLKATWMTST